MHKNKSLLGTSSQDFFFTPAAQTYISQQIMSTCIPTKLAICCLRNMQMPGWDINSWK